MGVLDIEMAHVENAGSAAGAQRTRELDAYNPALTKELAMLKAAIKKADADFPARIAGRVR